MKWQLTNRRGRPIVAGTLEQMMAHLKYTAKDGEYRLVKGDTSIALTRHQGLLYPFDLWEGFEPLDQARRREGRRE